MTDKVTAIISEMDSLLGKGVVRRASDPDFKVECLPTGVLPIDVLLGGGLPRGRFTEFFGNYSTLKSYVGLKAIATTQAHGGICALVDTEHAFDQDWAAANGVDLSSLLLPARDIETGEEAADFTEVCIRNGVDLVVWDSVAATLPKDERTKKLGEDKIQPARLAALMSIACRKLTAANSRTALLFINQTRLNVGVMFGSPETVPGGKALPFYASHRVALRKAGNITEASETKVWDGKAFVSAKDVVGINIKASLEKSKLTRPHRDVFFTYSLKDAMVDETGYALSYCVEHGLVMVEGSKLWFRGSQKRYTGAARFLGANADELVTRAKAHLEASHGDDEPRKRKVVRKKAK